MKELLEGNVPVSFAARTMKKSPNYIRAGLIEGWLGFGHAVRNGKLVTSVSQMDSRLGRINYYINPLEFYMKTGVKYNDNLCNKM